MKVLVSERILNELNISDKNQGRFLGAGDFQKVYTANNPKMIFKFPKEGVYNLIDLKLYKIMQNYPNLFPKILKITPKYVYLEKLETDLAESEYKKINTLLMDNLNISLAKVLDNSYENVKNNVSQYKDILKDLFPTFEKFVNLVKNISKIGEDLDFLDIHAGNFAYDKEGNLKMIDI